jgi:2-desacetyl-2-hydroxyethyl bacteriochlorophyllide A dehydrogenase
VHAFVMSDIGIGRRERIKDPAPAAGDVIIAPEYSGLCGTDVHMFNEGTLTRQEALPVVMGHEFVGRIVEFGTSDAASVGHRLRIGDAVAVEPLVPCQMCPQCRAKRPNLCADWSHLGILEDGCWADYVRVPIGRVTKLPEGVNPYDAALAEPLACAVNFVVHRGQLQPGQSVLIQGAGPIGLLSVCMARAAGASVVIVSEPHAHRRQAALKVGADVVVDPMTQDLPDTIRTYVPGAAGVDLIVEATGSKTAVSQSVSLAAPGSRIVLSGLGSGGPTPIDTTDIVAKELSILGGFASCDAMSTGLDAIAAGHVKTDDLVTAIYPWAEAEQAMQDMLVDPHTCKILFSHHSTAVTHPKGTR